MSKELIEAFLMYCWYSVGIRIDRDDGSGSVDEYSGGESEVQYGRVVVAEDGGEDRRPREWRAVVG